MKHMNLLPFNLQFFAEGEGSDGSDGAGSGSDGKGGEGGDQSQKSGAKTFTQEEVNAIGAKEKNQGKNSILKLFGCEDEETAKTEAEAFAKWKESQKTEDEKRQEETKRLQKEAKDSEKRATAAENKVSAMIAGVNANSIDDALAIALLKVTSEKNLDTVLGEMKKDSRYAGFFTTSSAGGTGSSADHNGGQGNKDNLGKRLAESRVANRPKESKFFKN